MGKCGNCGAMIEDKEIYGFFGESLCEDCYLERRVKPVACDPWAVWGARNTKGKDPQLTGIQEGILNLIKSEGPLEALEICKRLGLSETQFQNNFATLRHMELARGFKEGDKVRYTLF
jgi:hypothetical protein